MVEIAPLVFLLSSAAPKKCFLGMHFFLLHEGHGPAVSILPFTGVTFYFSRHEWAPLFNSPDFFPFSFFRCCNSGFLSFFPSLGACADPFFLFPPCVSS